MTDPIADFLIQIKNGYLARKNKIVLPHSRMKEALANLLKKEGYLKTVGVKKVTEAKKNLELELVYQNKQPRLKELKIVSSPGRRYYIKKGEIPRVLGGLGIAIISTPMGLITGNEARKRGHGGELICKIW